MDEFESLSHSKWECKYHVVFIPKCRRKVLYGNLRTHLGEVFRKLAEQKECRIEEGICWPTMYTDDLDTAEICRVASGWFHQGQERDPSCTSVRRTEAELRWSKFLGARLLRIDRRS